MSRNMRAGTVSREDQERRVTRAASRRVDGRHGEELALEFLVGRGFKMLERNYVFERGEIDLVMEEGEEIVFVEVKARRSIRFGEPEDSVTPAKQRQLRKVAEGYLFERGIEGRPCRFDVVAIRLRGENVSMKHYVNAFA